MQKLTNVIDIGSEKISVIIGSKGVNGSFNIRSFVNEHYEGFYNGEFTDLQSFKMALSEVICNIEKSVKKSFENCYIGLPAEFCEVRTSNASLTFAKERRVDNYIVDDLCEIALNKIPKIDDYVLINRAPISFVGSEGQHTTNPNELKTNSVSAELSFVFAKKSIVKDISKILKEIGIFKFNFVCSNLAQLLFLLNEETRKTENVIIDVGFITSSVNLCKGEGILDLFSFSEGGVHITADLCEKIEVKSKVSESEKIKIKFSEAENLKRSIILSIDKTDKDNYNILHKDKVLLTNALQANNICKARIESIATQIKKAINNFKTDFPVNKEVYLTGGGLSFMRGAKDYLSKCLGREVILIQTPSYMEREPNKSSVLSVLNFALLMLELEKGK